MKFTTVIYRAMFQSTVSINKDKLKHVELTQKELHEVDVRKNLIRLGIAFLIVLALVVLEVARHLRYLRHRDSGFVPGTQYWCTMATGVAALFMLGSIVFLVLHATEGA